LRRETSANSSQPSHSPILGTLEHPLELSETDSPPIGDAPLPDPAHPVTTNGHVHHSEPPAQEPTRNPEPEPEPVTTPPIPEPTKRKAEADYPVTQITPPVQRSEITVVPAPQIISQPTATTTSQVDNPERKRQNILTRTLWTFIMIGGFLGMSSPLYM
jgi:phosphatidate cytidylyltransferase